MAAAAAAAQFGFSWSKCVSVFGVTIVLSGEEEWGRRGNILIGLNELGASLASEEPPCCRPYGPRRERAVAVKLEVPSSAMVTH